MQQTVRLLGDLGERYGSEHKYHDLRSPADAIKLLCINQPALMKELVKAHEQGVGYTLVQAGLSLGYEDLQLPLGKNDLILTPVVAGSGGGGGTTAILLGVGLVAASIVFAPAGAGFLGAGLGIGSTTTATFSLAAGGYVLSTASVLSAGLSIAMGTIGAGLVLGGTAQLLSPQPEVPTLGGGDFGGGRTAPGQNTNATGPQGVTRATSGEQSYAFSGPANTVGVGATVPLVYGKMLIGSHLISSKVAVTGESDPTGEFFSEPGPTSITINGEKPGYKFKSHNGLRTRRWSSSQVKLGDFEEDGEFVRKLSSDVLKFSERKEEENDDMYHYDSEAFRGNFQILFDINNGLSRVIGNQTVPAFLTYEITIKKDDYPGQSPIFTNVRGTIQGLLKKGESYKFCHAVTYGLSGLEEGGDGETEVRVKVRIIDTDADNKDGQLVIRSLGYAHFHNSSENRTEDLVSET